MTFPLQTHGLWCSLCSSFSGSQTQTHTRIQHNLIFSCSVLSLCSLPFLTFPCRHAGRVLRRLVILKAKKEPKKKSHMHVPCVSSLGRRAGVGGQLEERKREKNKRGGVKGSISQQPQDSNYCSSSWEQTRFPLCVKAWRGLLYTQH